MKVLKVLPGPPDRKAQPDRKGRPGRKALRDPQGPPVHKEVPGSKALQAHKAPEAKRVRPVLRDRLARRASRGRQASCVTSKDPEMLSRAMMAKCLYRPFAKKVLLSFKERLGRNVPQQLAWLGSA